MPLRSSLALRLPHARGPGALPPRAARTFAGRRQTVASGAGAHGLAAATSHAHRLYVRRPAVGGELAAALAAELEKLRRGRLAAIEGALMTADLRTRQLLADVWAPSGPPPARGRAGRRGAEPIAIIGMGCRFPGGAATADDYWKLLRDGARRDRRRSRRTAGTSTPTTTPTPTRRARCARARGGFLDASRALRRRVLRHLAARGDEHGPAAAAAARGGLGGAGARRPAAGRPRRQRHRRLRRHQLAATTRSRGPGRVPATHDRRLRSAPATRYSAARAALLRARAAGARHGGRHGLLVVAGGRAPRLPEPAATASATWRWPAA